MREKQTIKKRPNRFLGLYTLRADQAVVGELRLKGSGTLLKLHSNEDLARQETASCIKGVAYTGECLTLIDCRSSGTGHTFIKNAPRQYYANVFPHHVAIGQCHVNPDDLRLVVFSGYERIAHAASFCCANQAV